MESYKSGSKKQNMKRYLLFWFFANLVSISFMVILSGTIQYYFPGLIPIGFGMYIDAQLFFFSWGMAVFTLVNVVFFYCYNTKKKQSKRRKRK